MYKYPPSNYSGDSKAIVVWPSREIKELQQMIEIPEAVTLAHQITDALEGKKIDKVTAAQSEHKFTWYNGDPGTYSKMLVNTDIIGGEAIGGFVKISTGEATLLFSDGVQLRLLRDMSDIPKKHQLLLGFSDGSALAASVRMYGGVICFKGDTYESEYYSAACGKPSPLTNDFYESYFDTMVNSVGAGKLSLKAFLATEQRIPGLGNGVLQDILYNAKLHPKRKLDGLTKGQVSDLFHSVRTTLEEMVRMGGRDTEKDLFGQAGRYVTKMSKHTVGQPCVVCGSNIEKSSYLGGSIYYCPECQNPDG